MPVDGETRFSVVTNVPAGTDVSGADVIRNATVFFVAPSSGRFIKKVDAVVLPGGSGVRVHTVIPAAYAGQTDMPGGDIKFDRTFAKVYIAAADGMNPERQRELSVVSVEIVNGRTGGYLFREGIFPEHSVSVLFPVNETIDQMNIHKPVCYLYPDDGGPDGTHLIVKLRNDPDGRVVAKRVLLCSRKNTAYKLTIAEIPGEDGGYAIQASDWEADILLPDAGQVIGYRMDLLYRKVQ